MIKPYTSEYFEKYLKFERDAKKEMYSLSKKDMKIKDYVQVFKKLKSIREKKPIPFSIIKTFYEQPEKFFGEYHSYLENTTFFDTTGNSIFCHLFYVLYVEYKKRNNIGELNENEKKFKLEVYESKFKSFLKEYERYFLLQDVALDTPLHKIAKRKDKGFFIELYQKLKNINLISNELLLTNNICDETICTYVLNEIKYNFSKIKNEEFYYNFINEHYSIYKSFSKEDQKILKTFSSKITFEKKQYKKENFNEIFNSLNDFVNNNLEISNLFEYIYFPFTSGINYLNCVFLICSKHEDYNKLFNLVNILSQKNEIINEICLSELCIIDHIKYVIRKMGLYNGKIEQEYNYGVKLIKEILSNIIKNKDEKGIKNLIGRKRFKKGLISNIIYNQSLSFDKKIELFDLFKEITKDISNKYIDRKTYNLYRFFKLCEIVKLTKSNINVLLSQNEYINKILKMNKFYEALIVTDIKVRENDDINISDTYINQRIKILFEFLDNNCYNTLKYVYNLSNEKVEKILYFIYVSVEKNENKNELFHYLYTNANELVKSFIISDINILKNSLDKMKGIFPNFLNYLFSSKFDLSHFIDFNNESFNKIANNLKEYFIEDKDIKPFLEYHLIKGKPFEDKYLSFFLIISGIMQKIDILLPLGENHFKKIISEFNYFYRRHLLEFWNLPFDYAKLSKTINRYILPFSKLFIQKKEVFKGIINEICPDLNLDVYFKAMDIVINSSKKSNFPQNALNHELPEDIVNDLYLNLIFIYIKRKFENQIPNLSVFLLIHLLKADYTKFINLFEDLMKQGNINNILNYIYFTEPCYSNEKYNIVNYLKKNNNSFCKKLKNLQKKSYIQYINYEKYMKFIKPFRKGYAFYDDNKNNKNIPYHKYTDFNEHFERLKYHKYSNEIHIRALAYYDIRKRSNDNEEDNYNFNYICTKLFDENYSFMNILNEPRNKINKYLYKKIISIIDYISKETINKEFNRAKLKDLKQNDESNEEKEYCCHCKRFQSKEDIKQGFHHIYFYYFNLYELFLCINEEKKTFFDILNNNAFFITQTSIIFDNFLEHCRYMKSERIKYITDKILEFYKMENENKYLRKLIAYNKNEFLNSFINKIQKMKDNDKGNIEKEYELLFNDKLEMKYLNLYIKIFEIFFESNEEYFFNYLNYIKNLYGNQKNKIIFDRLFRSLMNKNIEKFINIIPEFNNLFLNNLSKFKNSIIKNIIKSNKFELFFSQNIQNHTNIFSNFDDSLLILNFSENNKKASNYIMNKIKELFCQNDNNQLIIGFLKNAIINQYVFDMILKFISKKKDKNFVETNKSIIFESINVFCIKNAYYYVDSLLKLLKNYLPLEEIQSHIVTYELIAKTNIANTNSIEERSANYDQNEENEEDKYLLLNCLNNFKRNYETIAVLLNYCSGVRIYFYVFPFLYDIEIDNFMLCEKNSYLDYFSKSKNRDIIKSLNKNFYQISIFLESLGNQFNYIISLPKKVQKLFNYFISIIILEITPQEFLSTNFYDFDNSEFNRIINKRKELLTRYDWEKVKSLKFKDRVSELDLFMIFALYEIKGTPLVPISKYLPEFYSKIENYIKKFKSLKIPEICLKDSFDVRFQDNYLKNNLKNQKVKILKKIEEFPNLIFIIQKEYGNIFDVSESNEDIYYQQLIYNLIENRNIYSFSGDEIIANEYYLGLNKFRTRHFSFYEDSVLYMKKNFIQISIFSLKDFNRCSSLIIKKCAEKMDSNNWTEKEKIFDNYFKYLSIIKNICSFFILQSKNPLENQDTKSQKNLNLSNYELFILKEVLFQNEIDKITALKNAIDIKQIKYFILEQIKKCELNKIQHFDLAINWLDDYLKLNRISKKLNNLSQINLMNYFNYLNLCCEIIMNWLRKIEDIIKFSRYLSKNMPNFHISFKNNSNERTAKDEFSESLYRLCSSIIKNADYNNLPIITISYYLDENKEDYVETCSGQELIEFVKDKCISLDLFKSYLIYGNNDDDHKGNQLYLINKAINDKNIYFIYELLFSNKRINKNDKNLFNVFKPLFEPIFGENKNFICSYIKETATIGNEPNYDNCLSLIKYKFYNFFFNYIIPCLLFNYRLRIFCEDIGEYFGKTCYKTYINFNGIINSINKTKYHEHKNLNELFKIRAINYIINGDSTVRLHIEELYKYIKNKKKVIVTDTFVIKVVDGKKIKNENKNFRINLDNNNYKNDASSYSTIKPMKANNNNNKSKKKLKLKLKSRNSLTNEHIYFSIYQDNIYKRDNIPSYTYEGYVPSTHLFLGKSKGAIINEIFGSEYIKNDRKVENSFNLLRFNKDRIFEIPEIKIVDNTVKIVNVFDLMFTIKSISKNEIVVFQNDISNILEEYNDPNIFMSLLGFIFHDKIKKEVHWNMGIIEKYINENL